ncbi:hypothetical protein [Arthrobacter sp. C9C5]|uniref:hypothetical protein n=1 Tax=Arthrobacter sp. C9C5 TaxID=2735267 RepID=UPI0015844DA3|nr:hypothetical protein [Arthrobacter sp. C9C5]NUU29996.1 hypothetical protein [Arthrobacter sp. C9C5]
MPDTDHPPHGTEPGSSSSRPAGKITRLRLIAAIAAVAVIALIAVLLTVSFNPGSNSNQAAGNAEGTAEETPTQPAPTGKAPAVTYYKQTPPPAGSPLEKVDPLELTVKNEPVGTTLDKGTVGISLEATDLADPTLSADNATMVKLLKDSDDTVLRFGGNAVDRRFFWTSSGEALPAGYKGDKAHPARVVTPADLERVATLLNATNAKISLTVDLGHYDPDRAADMIKNASRIFGKRLLSFTVGNEPNGFAYTKLRPATYGSDEYIVELKAYANAIHAAAPDVVISGPGVYDQKWWKPFIDAELPQKKVLSFHNYPLYSCKDTKSEGFPTVPNLLGEGTRQRAAKYQQHALDAAKAAGLETWLAETGMSACPGSNQTTKTHATALWAADYALNAARLGITRLGFHSSMATCKGGPPMSVICSGGAYLKPNGEMAARANYFGMAMVADLAPGKFLNVDKKGGGMGNSYALKNADGSTTVVIVNENDPEKAAQTEVSLKLPGRALRGTMTQLSGPRLNAQDSTVIDGDKNAPVPAAKRPTVPGFSYGSDTQKFKLTAGTVTVLNFSY